MSVAAFHGMYEQALFEVVGEVAFITTGDGGKVQLGPVDPIGRDSKAAVEKGALVAPVGVGVVGISHHHMGTELGATDVGRGPGSPVQAVMADAVRFVGADHPDLE